MFRQAQIKLSVTNSCLGLVDPHTSPIDIVNIVRQDSLLLLFKESNSLVCRSETQRSLRVEYIISFVQHP